MNKAVKMLMGLIALAAIVIVSFWQIEELVRIAHLLIRWLSIN